MDPANLFAPDYAAARRGFLAAAEARGARLAAWPLRERGPAGEELALDCAWLGPEAPARVLAVSSGIHGVEGFAGSAIQRQLLEQGLPGLALPTDTSLLLVHAINPYGFAWRRRVNESNVDLNRNFLVHPAEHVPNPGYDALHDAINPERLDEASDAAARETLLDYAKREGFPELQEALTRGQYTHPRGVQFGGSRAEASNRALREIARTQIRGATQLAWIDLHTGLGPFGEVELIAEYEKEAPGYARARAWYGTAAKSTAAGESVSARLVGVMERGLEAELADRELTICAAEFGTYEAVRVFWAMRADNWLHQHGTLDSEQGRAIQTELCEVFCPADPHWRRSVLERGARVLRQARDGLCAA